nr:uncharacterized protein LOC104119656 [Nicotiana tomentosiformis]
MDNTSENSTSPPKESIPDPTTTPSTTPISIKGRFKMLARKVVATGEQIKKINEQLKPATEGEETVSSEIEQVTSGPKITSEVIFEVAANLENRFVLVGTMARVETTESGKIDKIEAMVVWSEESIGEEENLLRRGSDSYNPRKKKSSRVKILGTARANKKRKAASSIPVVTPPKRGRATRSKKKRSEAELEKALKESKRKATAKGNKKVGEPIEAVEIEEMGLVFHDEEEAEEVEVVTPKAKKIKTSTKKSPLKLKSAEPSTLAKRIRSALKSRKLKVVKEEESEEEKESDAEKDKMVKFEKRTILKGRLLGDLEEEVMMMLLEKLQLQEPGSSKKVPVNSKVRALVQESGAKNVEIEKLKKRLAEVESERDALMAELAKEKDQEPITWSFPALKPF